MKIYKNQKTGKNLQPVAHTKYQAKLCTLRDFLLSKGYALGKSLVEENLIIEAKNILEKSNKNNTKIVLPVDLVCSKSLEDKKNIKIVSIKNVDEVVKILKYTIKGKL